MMRQGLRLGIVLSIWLTTPAFAGDEATVPSAEVLAKGKAIVSEQCARCHSVEKTDASQHEDAPPFRDVANKYSVWLLAESLAEGIISGHPDMPEFTFEPDEIHAILSYMDSLKVSSKEAQ